jgi:hypothetical protein
MFESCRGHCPIALRSANGRARAGQASGGSGRYQPHEGSPRMNRMIFYPLAIGLFLLIDTVLRSSGH